MGTETTSRAAQGRPLRIPDGFSPELRLLLSLLRHALGTDTERIHPEQIDWRLFTTCVDRHRVGSFLHSRLPVGSRDLLPDAILAQLRRAAESDRKRALARVVELLRVARLFSDSGIPVTSVKGPLLALSLYGELGQRHAGDIDLLVAQRDVERADALLRAHGYRRKLPDFEMTPRQFSQFQRFQREIQYIRRDPEIRLELNWRLFHIAESASAQFEWTQVSGHRIATLTPEANALYLFAHGARHGWFRLFWLVDAAMLMAEGVSDWAAIARGARGLGVERSLSQGASLAAELLGSPMHDALSDLARQNPALGPLLAQARRQISKDMRPGAFQAEPVSYIMRRQSGWKVRWIVFKGRFMYPENWQLLPLPDRWFALHYAAAPVLWVYRNLLRRGRRSA
ncbi:MAG TPA: nucleotidyltransferase family protein [Opitutaceae bacterium]